MPTPYSGPSIVDYLKSVGQANDYSSRSKLAAQTGITGYMGTASQNTQLLNTLRNQSSPSPVEDMRSLPQQMAPSNPMMQQPSPTLNNSGISSNEDLVRRIIMNRLARGSQANIPGLTPLTTVEGVGRSLSAGQEGLGGLVDMIQESITGRRKAQKEVDKTLATRRTNAAKDFNSFRQDLVKKGVVLDAETGQQFLSELLISDNPEEVLSRYVATASAQPKVQKALAKKGSVSISIPSIFKESQYALAHPEEAKAALDWQTKKSSITNPLAGLFNLGGQSTPDMSGATINVDLPDFDNL